VPILFRLCRSIAIAARAAPITVGRKIMITTKAGFVTFP
jgi:hypothetical protein